MVSNRSDYIKAGLNYFPVSWNQKDAVKVLMLFSLVLSISAITLYFVAGFSVLYLAIAVILSVLMVYASVKLVRTGVSSDAWKLYKLSSFPYLGIMFLSMCLDIWI